MRKATHAAFQKKGKELQGFETLPRMFPYHLIIYKVSVHKIDLLICAKVELQCINSNQIRYLYTQKQDTYVTTPEKTQFLL